MTPEQFLELTPEGQNKLAMMGIELTAANKAIVALSEALENIILIVEGLSLPCPLQQSKFALTTHAPAIEKARGG